MQRELCCESQLELTIFCNLLVFMVDTVIVMIMRIRMSIKIWNQEINKLKNYWKLLCNVVVVIVVSCNVIRCENAKSRWLLLSLSLFLSSLVNTLSLVCVNRAAFVEVATLLTSIGISGITFSQRCPCLETSKAFLHVPPAWGGPRLIGSLLEDLQTLYFADTLHPALPHEERWNGDKITWL